MRPKVVTIAFLLIAAWLAPVGQAQSGDQMGGMKMESKETGQTAQKARCCRRMNHAGRTEGNGAPEASSFQSPSRRSNIVTAEAAAQQPQQAQHRGCSRATRRLR